MTDISTLAATAVAALAPYLAKGIESVASESGKSLWTWIKGKLSGSSKEKDLDALEADPENPKLQGKAESALESLLEAQPSLIAELTRLLEAAQAGAGDRTQINQVHTGSGDNVAGDKKIYNINKIDNANFS